MFSTLFHQLPLPGSVLLNIFPSPPLFSEGGWQHFDSHHCLSAGWSHWLSYHYHGDKDPGCSLPAEGWWEEVSISLATAVRTIIGLLPNTFLPIFPTWTEKYLLFFKFKCCYNFATLAVPKKQCLNSFDLLKIMTEIAPFMYCYSIGSLHIFILRCYFLSHC